MTAIITMSVKIGSVEGLMNICIPYSCVEPVIDKVEHQVLVFKYERK